MARRLPKSAANQFDDLTLINLINNIHDKLNGAMFNGGFETLAQNVVNIEHTQGEMLNKLDELHKVLYEPDDGLFARVKQVETSNREELELLKRSVADISSWKETLSAKDGFIEVTQTDSRALQDVIKQKKHVSKFLFGGGAMALLMFFKTIYELLSSHVSLH